ncbi:histidine kinase [Erythrobacter sp. HI0063]|jgi:light-regulated signal transduction histidine kinase (bacteriophytochrome)|uniref:HWE histidine kinase domain-containing protein n=1 Tax=Erythrobacter sp. HI0063 TaxID=1822240 RepID=UPI0007C3A23C|nr:HWE histidine kinase domain-containing protein [Erythrobacter sp. HI0063]KZY54772.1 histidine kinase [Erythrobacter sp. HI0063]
MNEHVDLDPVDLTNCDREPIHQIGAIQNFGALIAVTTDGMIAHRSANFADILSLSEPPEIGTQLSALFTPEAMSAIGRASGMLNDPESVERLFAVHLVGGKGPFDCAIHNTDGLTVIEFEPSASDEMDRQLRSLQPILRQLERSDDLLELCQQAADRLRDLLGFDRVMVYRFQSDESGAVIAESVEEGYDSFHGLRYPRTDIPQQARRLYLRNRFRIISDTLAEPVPIEPQIRAEGDPLDLSMSTLRAVSPIHIEYLINMGVRASLSISIVIDGKLWGLFACHHYAPKVLPYSLRTAAELFSELFSLTAERTIGKERASVQDAGRSLHDQLMRAIAGGEALVEALPTLRPIIKRAIPHDGISAYVDGEYRALGAAPDESEFMALMPALNSSATSRTIASDSLVKRIPAAAAFADRAVGALIIPVSRSPRDYVILWRRELKQTVTWAGNPEKPVELGPNGARLTPRKSFEAWQQSVTGKSAEWTEVELGLVESLRVTLLEVILRVTDELATERAKAQRQQELLIAELNHRVRNILNLIRGLINQSRHEAINVDEFARLIGGRINALASAHDNITRENWSPASVTELIETEAEAYVSGKLDRISIVGDEALVSPEAYTVLALVIHEMMTNSAKYGSLCDKSGRLAVEIACDESGMTICWKETGGPPVRAPERRGFGSTIIEKSIPFELNGRAELDFKLSGVEAEFWIPGRFITHKGRIDAASMAERARPNRKDTGMQGETIETLPSRVLLVEDGMIIAMDTEETLRDLGVVEVTIAAKVSSALKELEAESYDLAVLDYNLGTESSEPVAAKLNELGVPFWLATGYGEMADRLEEIGALGVLTKPYGKDELRRMLCKYSEIAKG